MAPNKFYEIIKLTFSVLNILLFKFCAISRQFYVTSVTRVNAVKAVEICWPDLKNLQNWVNIRRNKKRFRAGTFKNFFKKPRSSK